MEGFVEINLTYCKECKPTEGIEIDVKEFRQKIRTVIVSNSTHSGNFLGKILTCNYPSHLPLKYVYKVISPKFALIMPFGKTQLRVIFSVAQNILKLYLKKLSRVITQ